MPYWHIIGSEPWNSADKRKIASRQDPPSPPPRDRPNERLLYCARIGDTDEVKTLIKEHGADVHFQNDRPLLLAAGWGHLETVKALVNECGAAVHANGGVAIWQARAEKHKEISDFLEHAMASRPLKNQSKKPSLWQLAR
jgi:hypothetical protein